MAQMSLYRYYRAADGVVDPKGPLACPIPLNVLTEVNKQVKLVAAGQMKNCFTKLSHSICVRQGVENEELTDFCSYFPDFLWLLRDVTLEPTGNDGRAISPTEFLKTKVLCGSTKLKPTTADLVSMAIMNFFPSVECMMLPPPSSDANVVRNIVNNEHYLSKEFHKGVEEVVTFVCQSVKEKCAFNAGCSVDGPTLAALTEKYAEVISTPGSIPCLDNTWETVVNLRVKTIIDELTEAYESEMEAATKGKLPVEEGTLDINRQDAVSSVVYTLFGVHQSIWLSISERFLSETKHLMQSEDTRKVQCHEIGVLKKRIIEYQEGRSSDSEAKTYKVLPGCVLSKFVRRNYQESHEHCSQLFTDLYDPVVEKLNAACSDTHKPAKVQYTSEDLQIELNGLTHTYFSLAVGPAKQSIYNNKQVEIMTKMKELKDIEMLRADISKATQKQHKAIKEIEEHNKREKKLKSQNKALKNQIEQMKRENAVAIKQVKEEARAEVSRKLRDHQTSFQAKFEEVEQECNEEQKALIEQFDDDLNKLKRNRDALVADGKAQMQKNSRLLKGQCTECGSKTKQVVLSGKWKGMCYSCIQGHDAEEEFRKQQQLNDLELRQQRFELEKDKVEMRLRQDLAERRAKETLDRMKREHVEKIKIFEKNRESAEKQAEEDITKLRQDEKLYQRKLMHELAEGELKLNKAEKQLVHRRQEQEAEVEKLKCEQLDKIQDVELQRQLVQKQAESDLVQQKARQQYIQQKVTDSLELTKQKRKEQLVLNREMLQKQVVQYECEQQEKIKNMQRQRVLVWKKAEKEMAEQKEREELAQEKARHKLAEEELDLKKAEQEMDLQRRIAEEEIESKWKLKLEELEQRKFQFEQKMVKDLEKINTGEYEHFKQLQEAQLDRERHLDEIRMREMKIVEAEERAASEIRNLKLKYEYEAKECEERGNRLQSEYQEQLNQLRTSYKSEMDDKVESRQKEAMQQLQDADAMFRETLELERKQFEDTCKMREDAQKARLENDKRVAKSSPMNMMVQSAGGTKVNFLEAGIPFVLQLPEGVRFDQKK